MKVPLGSRLSDLDKYLPRGSGSTGEVTEWKAFPQETSKFSLTNEFGKFSEVPLGEYDSWRAAPGERDRFTGVIKFYDKGSTSSDMSELVYIAGRLKSRDWGFLPD